MAFYYDVNVTKPTQIILLEINAVYLFYASVFVLNSILIFPI